MASDISQRMEALRRGTAGAILAEWLKERLAMRQEQFMNCSKETFEAQKGRCHELNELIKFIEGR